MTLPELCTEAEVAELVGTFYARVRGDAILGPVFERHVADWSRHLPNMIAFWSAALRGSKDYHGNPMLLHRALPGLTHTMFQHWLDLFEEVASAQPNRTMGERAVELSRRIAQGLWSGYQAANEPDRVAVPLRRRAGTPRAMTVLE